MYLAAIRKKAGLPARNFTIVTEPNKDLVNLGFVPNDSFFISLKEGTVCHAALTLQYFHGTCGVLTIDHLYDGGELENFLRALMTAFDNRLFLYVGNSRRDGEARWNNEDVLSKLGKVVFPFNNPFHGRSYTLPLWALTNDPTIIKEGIK